MKIKFKILPVIRYPASSDIWADTGYLAKILAGYPAKSQLSVAIPNPKHFKSPGFKLKCLILYTDNKILKKKLRNASLASDITHLS